MKLNVMNEPLLSVLICTIPSRSSIFEQLIAELYKQATPYIDQVEIRFDSNPFDSIGEKRNRLLESATGKYVCFVDDDDSVSIDYIDQLMKAVESGCDCASLKGLYSVDGVADGIFEHSLKYDEWRTTANEIKYERYPNHLNAVKSSIAKLFKYPEKNHGEDHDWSTQVHNSDLIKTEYYISEVIYFYRFNSKK